ncbi:methyl-accepting chemotaxis protein [Chitinilyticum piscinae]|uniref:Methyl-accepting chemotaxis protein n=1 Tax=Chitinilyticum piscinae TaxID=2866724 RepID=A0A8J7FZ54_9NEIS|nr:methyl-accepting chemotaxis protein [Chitinilyticum piscinae]MBE9608363.1 methyl-accepting chemotaxis protein [Chitinilyticum piscinae]
MRILRNLSLPRKLQLAFLLVSLLTVGIFTAQSVSSARQSALRAIDAQLMSATRSYVLLLGADYHDKLPPREQADLPRKHAEALKLTEATKFLGLNYLYSYVVRDGKVLYTQASLSDEQARDPSFEFYLKPSDTPETDADVIRAVQTGQPVFLESNNPQYGALRSLFLPLKNAQGEFYVACADISAELVATQVRAAGLTALVTGVLLLLLAIVVSLLLGRALARPLLRLRDMMQALTSGHGDLTIRLEVDSRDEIGDIARHFNTFMEQLRQMFLLLRDDTVKLTSGVQQLGRMTEQLSEGAREQADTASATAATIEQITVSINHIADFTRDANANAQETGRLSERSAQSVTEVAGEVDGAATAVNNLAGVMAGLDQSSQQISAIAGVIKDIADQTNLLALNAAIEAARAGEQGRGFAVVADEVRKLAERTGTATVEIDRMIGSIRSQTDEALASMQQTHCAVQDSVGKAASAADQIRDIRERMARLVEGVGEISTAASEQSAATTIMAQSAERISQMAQQGEQSISLARRVSDDMAELASQLQAMVGRFRL